MPNARRRTLVYVIRSSENQNIDAYDPPHMMQLVKLSDNELNAINAIHKKPGQHKTLLMAFAQGGVVFGWSFDQLGWALDNQGFAKE